MSPISTAESVAHARARLAARLRELNEEIRAYPQPIARCDAQLGGLLEERSQLHQKLEALRANPGRK